MSIVNPYAGSSKQRLSDLLNSVNTRQYHVGVHYDFGHMFEYSDDYGRNTSIEIIPRSSMGDIPPQRAQFRRLPLNLLGELPFSATDRVTVTLPFYLHDVLEEINSVLGMNLEPHEVENAYYDTSQSTYRLTITENSEAWIEGSFFDFRALVHGEQIPISDVIMNTTLQGLSWN